jgi:serine/threonine protein kinase
MEFLEGESLRQALKRRGALPLPEVAEILQQAAWGLNAAHKLGIIHRDLKPDNVFLTRGDEGETIVKVVDFGIAKLRESGTHTQTGMVLGTPAYMSFEQASGMRSDELDARSDVYSLGVVVYEMLTSRTPFQSDTPVGYLRMHMQEDPPPFRTVKPDLPALPQLKAVVMKALTKDRNQRYSSVLEFVRELPKPPSPRPWPNRRRRFFQQKLSCRLRQHRETGASVNGLSLYGSLAFLPKKAYTSQPRSPWPREEERFVVPIEALNETPNPHRHYPCRRRCTPCIAAASQPTSHQKPSHGFGKVWDGQCRTRKEN